MGTKIFNIFLIFISLTLAEQPCQTPNGDFGECKPLYQCPSLSTYYDHIFVSPVILEYTKRSYCGFTNEEPKVCCHLRRHVPTENRTAKVTFVSSNLLPKTNVCGIGSLNKVTDGETKIDEYPWLALLFYKDDFGTHYGCGGVLINEKYVLTSAHCAGPDLGKVRLGEWNTDTNPDCKNGECAPPHIDTLIQEKILFQGYASNDDVSRSYNDIALLRLQQKIQFSRFIRPICLPTTVDEIFNNYMSQKLAIAGWGRTNDGFRSKIKLKLEVNVTSCRISTRDAGQICAGGEENKDSCDGDSGGPLMVTKADDNGNVRAYVVGILSFGADPCGQKDKPAVHTKVAKYLYWIVDNLKP